jgi:nucleoside 2-deoxyribosyltransferase
MRIYLAGPMRGRVEHNFPAFRNGAALLRLLGHEVVSPAEHDLDLGFDPKLPLEAQNFDLRAALAWDLEQVLAADAVVTLFGWQHSAGARAEVATAQAAGIPTYDFSEMQLRRVA